MNEKICQTVKWLTTGILIGYVGKYALALFKAKRDQNSSFTSNTSQNDSYEDAHE